MIRNVVVIAAICCALKAASQDRALVGEVTSAATSQTPFVQRVLDLTNDIRAKHGLQPLRLSEKLCEVAKWMADDMAQHSYFDHTDRLHRKLAKRLEDFGYRYQLAGENIAAGQLAPEKVVDGWMNSPGHRANILRADFVEIGIGFSANGKGYYRDYWVQNFGVPANRN